MSTVNGYFYRGNNSEDNGYINGVSKASSFSLDDKGASSNIASKEFSSDDAAMRSIEDNFASIKHSHNLFDRNDIDLYNKIYRFGLFNPFGSISTTREFLFFTKPDLNILSRDNTSGVVYNDSLNENLEPYPFWRELIQYRKRVINALQSSSGNSPDNFNHLLQNQVISNLSVPGLTATTIETPSNMYGVNYYYRGSSEASDDSANCDFSLEFKDTKWLDVYYFFKAYEEYETLKHHGVVAPWKKYIEDKVLHDQFAIYKFLVDEDMETVIYYAKYYGVFPASLPRDVFSNSNFDNGLSYSVDFKAAFFEDMKPEIISDFNALSKDYYDSLPYRIDIYNEVFDRTDNRPAQAAYVEAVENPLSPNGYSYKLRWKGSDQL